MVYCKYIFLIKEETINKKMSWHSYNKTNIRSIFEIIQFCLNINGGDVQRKNVVNNVDKSSLWAP